MKSLVTALLFGALIDAASAIGVREVNSSSTGTSIPSTTTAPSVITSISSSPSSITAAANASMCASGNPGLAVYAGYTDASLQCYCASQFSSWYFTTNPPTRTLTIIRANGPTTETITTLSSTITTSFAASTTVIRTETENIIDDGNNEWIGTAVSPCCSSCTIAAQTVNLFYWPVPPVPNQATEFVNSDGYLFVSPSVYIGFTTLSAFDYCGKVGNVYTSTTFAFGPSELSTVGTQIPSTRTITETYIPGATTTTTDTQTETLLIPGPVSVLNYRDLGQNCSSISGYSFLAGFQNAIETYDPCHPVIVLPSRVRNADPAWASCVQDPIGGFYDPPFLLTSQSGLLPFSSTSSLAAPAQTPQSDQAASTTTSPVQQTSTPPADPIPSSSPAPPVEPTSPLEPAPPSTTPPAPPVEPTSSSEAAPPTISNPSPVLPESTPTQDPGSPSPATSPQAPPVIESQTVTPGGNPIISGTILSPEPSGSSAIVNGGSALPITAIAPSQTPVLIGSQTIVPGGSPVTVSSVIFSLPSSGGGVVMNGVSATPTASLEAPLSSLISAPTILGAQTLVPGGSPVTLDGTTFSLQPTGSNIIVNGNAPTIPLSSANQISSSAADGIIGSAIASIAGVGPTATTLADGSTLVPEGSSSVPIASASGTNPLVLPTTGGSRVGIKMDAISLSLLVLLGMLLI